MALISPTAWLSTPDIKRLLKTLVRILEAATLFLSTPKGETVDRFYASSSVIWFMSLFIGEIGRKRSRVIFLKLYLFCSSIAVLISVAFLVKSEKLFELIEDFSKWETSMAKMFKVAVVLLEVIVQTVTIGVTSSLVRNMAPPKRAS
ncbi:uncharacterized protein LOC111377031 isoform X1 [Olea europaea var. sylvestris]|uniref:uncharacterized protein LOC111377031 isoform X1 n=1 Tax=Olea europaea var. sylvestris TaxID=158386 RepID=UPI000C1D1D40|nr:uncharacterized protein LOC111377031 isoform X1 [Olea europaea var. sylvestris]